MSARILDCTPAEYYADPCEVPALSQSTAHTLLEESPLEAYLAHPRLGGMPNDPTDAMEAGNLVDALVLGGSDGRIVPIGFDDFRSKEAKAQRAAARAEGKTPVIRAKYEAARGTAVAIRERLTALGYPLTGGSQVALEWREGDVLCRGRLDHLELGARATILDLKKTTSLKARDISQAMYSYGCDIQCAAYTSAVEKLRPDLAGRIDMIFLFVQVLGKSGRVKVQPVEPTGLMRQVGQLRWQKACAVWAECLRTNHWPDGTEQVLRIDPPLWAPELAEAA